jgi:hypothetical protein
MFHNSVNVHLNHLKLWIWKHQFIKKYRRSNFFSKNSKWRSNSRWRYYFILSALKIKVKNVYILIAKFTLFFICQILIFAKLKRKILQEELFVLHPNVRYWHNESDFFKWITIILKQTKNKINNLLVWFKLQVSTCFVRIYHNTEKFLQLFRNK